MKKLAAPILALLLLFTACAPAFEDYPQTKTATDGDFTLEVTLDMDDKDITAITITTTYTGTEAPYTIGVGQPWYDIAVTGADDTLSGYPGWRFLILLSQNFYPGEPLTFHLDEAGIAEEFHSTVPFFEPGRYTLEVVVDLIGLEPGEERYHLAVSFDFVIEK